MSLTTAAVTVLVVLGSALEIRAGARISEALKKLLGLQARTTRVLMTGHKERYRSTM